MKAQIRTKTRIRGATGPIFAAGIKKMGTGGLAGLVAGDALAIRWMAFPCFGSALE
jgi:hypothetical protein